jgi:hypothetical protein
MCFNEGNAPLIANVMGILNEVWKEISWKRENLVDKDTTVTFETFSDSVVIDVEDNN